jgi:hypothetical protein
MMPQRRLLHTAMQPFRATRMNCLHSLAKVDAQQVACVSADHCPTRAVGKARVVSQAMPPIRSGVGQAPMCDKRLVLRQHALLLNALGIAHEHHWSSAVQLTLSERQRVKG